MESEKERWLKAHAQHLKELHENPKYQKLFKESFRRFAYARPEYIMYPELFCRQSRYQ